MKWKNNFQKNRDLGGSKPVYGIPHKKDAQGTNFDSPRSCVKAVLLPSRIQKEWKAAFQKTAEDGR